MNKKIINHMPFGVCTVLNLEGYCSMLLKFDTFNTFDKTSFLVFDMPNVPYYSI